MDIGSLNASNSHLRTLFSAIKRLTYVHTPLVSVVIPAYNQADFLGEAIQSVLNQTYANFELLIVNDASPDHTDEVVRQFCDPRIKYLVHSKNQGLPATRNTGMSDASGSIIALLDADDYFHPDKLAVHVDYLARHPEIGVTYNSRFELDFSARTIRRLWRPPLTAGLADFVLGFPFAPSDMVIRTQWARQVGHFDPQYIGNGEDTDFPCRLALAGCQFASVDRALNFRRYHSRRPIRNLQRRRDNVARAQNTVFHDPRCPHTVLSLQDRALKIHLMALVFLAFHQGETDLGQMFVRELVRIAPGMIGDQPCELMDFLLQESIADENVDHENVLRRILAQLPAELMFLTNQYEWAVGQGYIRRGVSNIMWGRPDKGTMYLQRAIGTGAALERSFVHRIVADLLNFEAEFGAKATIHLREELSHHLACVGTRSNVRWLNGCYFINRAFQAYKASHFDQVPGHVLRATQSDLSYLTNRGAISITLRSFLRLLRQRLYTRPSPST